MKKLLLLATIFFVTGLAFAQDADKITELLDAKHITYAQAAYICGSASGDFSDENAAFEALKSSGAIGKKYSAGDKINFRNFSHLCANTWNVKGSLFLAMFKNPRYAFRQLQADEIIRSGTDGSKPLSGREALNIINKCIEKYELKENKK